MVNIDRLTVKEALAVAEQMQKRGRTVLCHQILDQLELRCDQQIELHSKRKPRPRKRNAKTGEIA